MNETDERLLWLEWGAEIERRMKALGMSRKQFADAIGISQVSLGNIINGRFAGRDKTRHTIARALGCQVADIYVYPRVEVAA